MQDSSDFPIPAALYPECLAPSLRDPLWGPGWFPHHFDLWLRKARVAELDLDVLADLNVRGAGRRRHRDLYCHIVGIHLHVVNQPEIDDIQRNLWIEAFLEDFVGKVFLSHRGQ